MGKSHGDWWEAVKELPDTNRFVAHEPETPRYARARQKLRYLLRKAVYLGISHTSRGDDGRIEIAVWAAPDQGRGPGYYGCFRLFVESGVVTGAVLFCFYDGTEKSPRLSSLQDAQAFARANGFVEETENEIDDQD
jgi:hypothetical protein